MPTYPITETSLIYLVTTRTKLSDPKEKETLQKMAEEFHEGVPVEEQQAANPGGDVQMGEGQAGDQAGGGEEGGANTGDLPFAEGGEADPRPTFISYLTSPVVTLIVGAGENETILTAHQALLVQSPFFAEACAAFTNDGSVRWT